MFGPVKVYICEISEEYVRSHQVPGLAIKLKKIQVNLHQSPKNTHTHPQTSHKIVHKGQNH